MKNIFTRPPRLISCVQPKPNLSIVQSFCHSSDFQIYDVEMTFKTVSKYHTPRVAWVTRSWSDNFIGSPKRHNGDVI